MEDIAPALLEQIKELYKNEKESSIKIKNILEKLKEKNANFVDASEYANELGEILSKVFGDTFSVEVLPDGKMYYNIAKRTVEPTMKALQSDIADLTEELQEQLNKQAGLGIKPLRPELNQDKIDGIIDRLSNAENFDDIKWILNEPIKTFARSVVDDAIKTNAEFHGKSGLTPKVIRKSSGNCCKWCTNLVGVYDYPNVPKDVYRRHNRCRCTVDYVVGKRKQNVWTKTWSEEIEPEKIAERKAVKYGEEIQKEKGNAINKHGNEIQFEFTKMSEARQKMVRETIEELASKYETNLTMVTDGASIFGKNRSNQNISGVMTLSGGDTKSVVVHEFGHSLAMMKAEKKGLQSNSEFWKEMKKLHKEYKEDVYRNGNREYSLDPFGYAEDIDEFLAEGFEATILNADNVNEKYPKKIIHIIDKYFKKK